MLGEIVFMLSLLIFIILTLVLFAFIVDSMFYGHDISTSRRVIKELIKIIKRYHPSVGTFYDLGSGRGEVVLTIKRELPSIKVYGLDKNRLRMILAKFKAIILRQKIVLNRQDIFETDLSQADVVYCYLWYDLMPALEKKLRQELKPGAIVVANTTNFPNWRPCQKIVINPKITNPPNFETLFVYMKK
ncbi:class I SAM-dependent methyltransferase [Patescibacteria group bacterium]|nr:class I SAM-dependent methyltransferase [Patescibacteria group bacterium]